MLELIYKIMQNKIKELEKCNLDEQTIRTTMEAQLNKYFKKFKMKDTQNINLIEPKELDMIMYLVYMWLEQKRNDVEVMDNIKKLIEFKLDINKVNIDKNEITNLIDLFETQIKLK